MNRQRGQSLVEFATGSAALLLLLLGVITLSGYQELQRRALGAARQITYEATWQPRGVPAEASARRTYLLHFDDAGLLDATGRARLVAADDVRLSRQSSMAPGIAGDSATLLLAPLQAGMALTGGAIDLEAGGYVSGELVAHVVPRRSTPDPFRNLDTTLRQPYAILADPWNSGNSRQTGERSASLVPTQGLVSLAAIWHGLSIPLSIIEPAIGKLCLGLIEPEMVPEDRLGPQLRGVAAGRNCQ